MTSINSLIASGIRPGVDSSIASSELSKSKVALYEAQKNLDQIQVQLATLSGLPALSLLPDTNAEVKLITSGGALALSATIDTAHHPDIDLYKSLSDLSRARLQLEKKRFYPKIMLDADVWTRGSSLSSADKYNSDLLQGYAPNRLNYFVGITFTYDILNIVRKKLSTDVSKFEVDASEHMLQQERDNINNELQRAQIETSYQLNRLKETDHQLRSATIAYAQQENLYRNGLSSVIDLNIALNSFIQARRDHLDSKVGYMRSILNYSLVTNSFNSLVQTLKL
jgi:outer membrane protein TolC